jgi:hypothetical protein
MAPELDLSSDGDLPSNDVIAAVAEIPILDAEGKERPFKSLYTPSKSREEKRVLVIFVRHFLCDVSWFLSFFSSPPLLILLSIPS